MLLTVVILHFISMLILMISTLYTVMIIRKWGK